MPASARIPLDLPSRTSSTLTEDSTPGLLLPRISTFWLTSSGAHQLVGRYPAK